MSLDHEQLKRRRQELAQKRKQENKKLLIRAGIAGAVLVVLILVIFLVSKGKSDPDPTDPTLPEATGEQTTPSDQQTEASETTPAADTVIHLAATGDLDVTDLTVAAGGENGDFSNTFLDVAHLLGTADISIINLEGNAVGAPYGSAYRSAPKSMLDTLNASGVDLIQLANSYSIKNGISGLGTTIDAVRSSGMEPVGVFANEESYDKSGGFTLCNVKGVRIAFVAFTKGMDGMTLPSGSQNCVNVLYEDYDGQYREINTAKIDTVMSAVNKQKPDLIVAMVHWGSEFNDSISTSQQKICQQLQSRGADAIIGTHSHYVQQMQFDEATGQFVAYSLGDFMGSGAWMDARFSVVLDLEITKNGENGDTRITGYSYTPIYTIYDEDVLRVVRINETISAYESGYVGRVSEATYNAMKQALTSLEKRITKEVS